MNAAEILERLQNELDTLMVVEDQRIEWKIERLRNAVACIISILRTQYASQTTDIGTSMAYGETIKKLVERLHREGQSPEAIWREVRARFPFKSASWGYVLGIIRKLKAK